MLSQIPDQPENPSSQNSQVRGMHHECTEQPNEVSRKKQHTSTKPFAQVSRKLISSLFTHTKQTALLKDLATQIQFNCKYLFVRAHNGHNNTVDQFGREYSSSFVQLMMLIEWQSIILCNSQEETQRVLIFLLHFLGPSRSKLYLYTFCNLNIKYWSKIFKDNVGTMAPGSGSSCSSHTSKTFTLVTYDITMNQAVKKRAHSYCQMNIFLLAGYIFHGIRSDILVSGFCPT